MDAFPAASLALQLDVPAAEPVLLLTVACLLACSAVRAKVMDHMMDHHSLQGPGALVRFNSAMSYFPCPSFNSSAIDVLSSSIISRIIELGREK